MLSEDRDAAERFALNKKIISFGEIPKELSDSVLRRLNEALYEDEPVNGGTDLKNFMNW